jgi:hypothetical protein
VGWQTLNLDRVTESWEFVRGSLKRWVRGYECIWLVDEKGKVIREIRRRPDHDWLVRPYSVALAPDGTALVACEGALNVYAADGSPVRTILIPGLGLVSSVAFDGTHAVVGNGPQVLVVNARTGKISSFLPPPDGARAETPGSRDAYWKTFFGPRGELWIIDLNRRPSVIERYEMLSAQG